MTQFYLKLMAPVFKTMEAYMTDDLSFPVPSKICLMNASTPTAVLCTVFHVVILQYSEYNKQNNFNYHMRVTLLENGGTIFHTKNTACNSWKKLGSYEQRDFLQYFYNGRLENDTSFLDVESGIMCSGGVNCMVGIRLMKVK